MKVSETTKGRIRDVPVSLHLNSLEIAKLNEWERIGQSAKFYLPKEGIYFVFDLLTPLFDKFDLPKYYVVDGNKKILGEPKINPKIDGDYESIEACFKYGENDSYILLKLNNKNKIDLESLVHEIVHYCHYRSKVLTLSSNKNIEEEETELITNLILRPLKSIIYYLMEDYKYYLLLKEKYNYVAESNYVGVKPYHRRLLNNALKIFLISLSKRGDMNN